MDKVDLVVEVKRHGSGVSAWQSASRDFMPEGGADSRGQIYATLREIMKRQSRNHVFLLSIHDPWCTVVRVDHAAIIVSDQVNMRTDPRPVVEFLHRYASADKADRGFDASMRVVDKKEAEVIEMEIITAKPSLPKDLTSPKIEFEVPNVKGETIKVYGVKQHTIPDDLLGRCTSTWIVWMRGEREMAFMKDTWRADVERRLSESEIIHKLHENGVPHIPTLLGGGDLAGPGQSTKSQEFNKNRIVKRRHHRQLQGHVSSFVDKAKTPKLMFTAIYHAFQGRLASPLILVRF